MYRVEHDAMLKNDERSLTLNMKQAKEKLDEAIQNYARACEDNDTLVSTDYVLTVASIDMHTAHGQTYYHHAHSGPLHTRAGLLFMHDEEVKMLNREEANA
jgi:hypothetical protein